MAKKITIYEPNLCCPSGVCGPNPDQTLIKLQDAIDKLKNEGIETERFTITSHPKQFTQNTDVMKLMQEKQLEALPITTIDGKVIKVGSYPSLEDLKQHI